MRSEFCIEQCLLTSLEIFLKTITGELLYFWQLYNKINNFPSILLMPFYCGYVRSMFYIPTFHTGLISYELFRIPMLNRTASKDISDCQMESLLLNSKLKYYVQLKTSRILKEL